MNNLDLKIKGFYNSILGKFAQGLGEII